VVGEYDIITASHKSENPTHGSGWMGSSPCYKARLPEHIEIPPGQCGDRSSPNYSFAFLRLCFDFQLHERKQYDLNHPHTAVWGIFAFCANPIITGTLRHKDREIRTQLDMPFDEHL